MSNRRYKRDPEVVRAEREFAAICEGLRFQQNEYIWSRVLFDLDSFLATCKRQFEFFENKLANLANIYQKFNDGGDTERTRSLVRQQKSLKLAIDSITKNMREIERLTVDCVLSDLKMDAINCPITNSLTTAIYEHHRLSKEIADYQELQTITEKMKSRNVRAFKGISTSKIDLSALEMQLDTIDKAILEYKKLILPK